MYRRLKSRMAKSTTSAPSVTTQEPTDHFPECIEPKCIEPECIKRRESVISSATTLVNESSAYNANTAECCNITTTTTTITSSTSEEHATDSKRTRMKKWLKRRARDFAEGMAVGGVEAVVGIGMSLRAGEEEGVDGRRIVFYPI